MKKLVRLTEGDLHNIVKNSVRRAINEIGDTPKGQYALGRLANRYNKDKSSSIEKYAYNAQLNSDNNPDLMDQSYYQGERGESFYPQEGEMQEKFQDLVREATTILYDKSIVAQILADNAEVLVYGKFDGTISDFVDLCEVGYALQGISNDDPMSQDSYDGIKYNYGLNDKELDIVEDLNLSAMK